MKIAIVEDEKEHAGLLSSYLEQWGQTGGSVPEIKRYESAEAFLFAWEEEQDFSAVFLDIQMGKMNGLELAKRIRRDDRSVGIIFTTGIADYLQEGYEVEALHYLIKPISPEKVRQCMDRIAQRERKERPCLCIKLEAGVWRVETERIWWISALRHNVVICVEKAERNECFLRQEALNGFGELEEALRSDESFLRCHRSYLVNLSHVRRIEKADVVMDNGDRIPLSRRLYKEVNERFIRYFTERRNG